MDGRGPFPFAAGSVQRLGRSAMAPDVAVTVRRGTGAGSPKHLPRTGDFVISGGDDWIPNWQYTRLSVAQPDSRRIDLSGPAVAYRFNLGRGPFREGSRAARSGRPRIGQWRLNAAFRWT